MSWKDDLAELLTDVATSGAGQTVGGVLGSAPAQAAFTALDVPLSVGKYGMGALLGGINEGLGKLPGQRGFEPGTSEAFRRGGPRAAWEEIREDEPLWFQAATEVGLDPLTYTGVGGARKVATGMREAQILQEAAGNAGIARGSGAIAKGLEVAQGINDAPGLLLKGGTLPARLGGAHVPGLQAGITRTFQPLKNPSKTGLLDLSPKAQLKQELDEIYNLMSDDRASGVMLPSPSSGESTKSLTLAGTGLSPHPGLTIGQNSLLAREVSDGRSYGQFLDETRQAATDDAAMLSDDGVSWKADETTLDGWLKAARGKPNQTRNERIIRGWHKVGYDPLYTSSPDDTAVKMLGDQLKKDRGIREGTGSYLGSLVMSAWGEQALFSGKYQTSNIQGNILMSAVEGHMSWAQVNPMNFIRNFKIYNAGSNKIERDRLIAGLKTSEQAVKYGQERAPVNVLGSGGIQAAIGGQYESAMGEIAKKVTGSERIGTIVGKPFVWNNRVSLGVDLVPRDAIYSDIKGLAMSEGLVDWNASVRAAGVDDFAAFGKPNSPPSMAAGPLRAHLMGLGIDQSKAEGLVKDFVELRGAADALALKEMSKIQFDYLRTNLDEQVAKFVPFHYWYSRALRYWGEASVRNPYLMLNYMRANRGIEEAQSDPGLDARQKGFLKLMGTPMGFSLLMNPDALFGVVRVFDLNNPENPGQDPDAKWSDAPSGMTPIGGVLDWMKQHGPGLYPWYDGLINMMGAYGNTFEPDLLGIRLKGLVGASVNFAMAQAGAHPPGTPYADAMGKARWVLSSTASQFMPGWLAQPVLPKAGGSTQQASLETIIEHIVLTDMPGVSGKRLFEIMSDPDSPEYERAYRTAASAGVVKELLNFFSPAQFNLRNDAKDVRFAQKKTIEEAAEEAGESPFRFAPTVGDIEFAAKYKRLTGKDWRPGDYEDAKFKIELARAPAGDAKRFVYEDAAYRELGTPTQKATFKTFYALKHGDDPRTAGLTPEVAEEKARLWLSRSGNAESIDAIYAQRDSFSALHPAYKSFLDWKEKMRQVQSAYGDLSEYRRQASLQNPNAARYFADNEAFLLRTEPDPEKLRQRIDEDTLSVDAYQSIHGIGRFRSQAGATPGAPMYDTALPEMAPAIGAGGGGGGGVPYNPQENWMAQLASYGQSQGIDRPRR